jgi:hypothetical protein
MFLAQYVFIFIILSVNFVSSRRRSRLDTTALRRTLPRYISRSATSSRNPVGEFYDSFTGEKVTAVTSLIDTHSDESKDFKLKITQSKGNSIGGSQSKGNETDLEDPTNVIKGGMQITRAVFDLALSELMVKMAQQGSLCIDNSEDMKFKVCSRVNMKRCTNEAP